MALDTNMALHPADLHRAHRLATAEAVTYATAQAQQAQLLTCGAHFESLPAADYFSEEHRERVQ